jgi:hypothetical protein
MTADTTFKEFVEERGLRFSLLDFGSREYRNLVKVFNEAKLKLEAEEEAPKYEEMRAKWMLNGQSAAKGLSRRHAQRPKGGASFPATQPQPLTR